MIKNYDRSDNNRVDSDYILTAQEEPRVAWSSVVSFQLDNPMQQYSFLNVTLCNANASYGSHVSRHEKWGTSSI